MWFETLSLSQWCSLEPVKIASLPYERERTRARELVCKMRRQETERKIKWNEVEWEWVPIQMDERLKLNYCARPTHAVENFRCWGHCYNAAGSTNFIWFNDITHYTLCLFASHHLRPILFHVLHIHFIRIRTCSLSFNFLRLANEM